MSGDVADLKLRADDAIELAELLDLLRHLLEHAPSSMAEALASFCGAGYDIGELRADLARFDIGELRADLARFAFLLDGDPERFKFKVR